MSQQQGLWFTYKNGTQEAYWSKFKGEGEFAMLVTDFKGSGDGYQPQNLGPFTKDGFSYTASTKTSKKTGKPYWVIQRKKLTGDPIIDNLKSEEQKAHESSTNWDEVHKRQEERDAAFEKRHNQLITALENLTESVNALIDALSVHGKAVQRAAMGE